MGQGRVGLPRGFLGASSAQCLGLRVALGLGCVPWHRPIGSLWQLNAARLLLAAMDLSSKNFLRASRACLLEVSKGGRYSLGARSHQHSWRRLGVSVFGALLHRILFLQLFIMFLVLPTTMFQGADPYKKSMIGSMIGIKSP